MAGKPASPGACKHRDTVYVTFKKGVGIWEEEHLQNIHIYPNPTSGLVYLDLSNSSKSIKELRILDLNGKELAVYKSFSNPTQELKIDLSWLPEGIFVLKINKNTYQQNNDSQKIIPSLDDVLFFLSIHQ